LVLSASFFLVTIELKPRVKLEYFPSIIRLEKVGNNVSNLCFFGDLNAGTDFISLVTSEGEVTKRLPISCPGAEPSERRSEEKKKQINERRRVGGVSKEGFRVAVIDSICLIA